MKKEEKIKEYYKNPNKCIVCQKEIQYNGKRPLHEFFDRKFCSISCANKNREYETHNCGIYCIENKINHKKYIGLSIDIEKRWQQHRTELKYDYHDNSHLQRAWNKYGEENFEFYILELCNVNELHEKEKYYIEKYKSSDGNFGYNFTAGGEGMIGYHHSEETRKKLSEAMIGKKLSDEWKEHIRAGHKQRVENGLCPDMTHLQDYYNSLKKKVYCYSAVTGEYITSYESGEETARQLNTNPQAINHVLRNKDAKTVHGYYLTYEGDYLSVADIFKRIYKKPICQIDEEGNILKIYSTAVACGKEVGIHPDSIGRFCNGKCNVKDGTINGYIFRFL